MIRTYLLSALLVIVGITALYKPQTAKAFPISSKQLSLQTCLLPSDGLSCSHPLTVANQEVAYTPLWSNDLSSLVQYSPYQEQTVESLLMGENVTPLPFPLEEPQPSVSPTPTPTPKPTLKPAAIQIPVPSTVEMQPLLSAPALDSEIIYNLINNHRAEIGLPPFQKNDQLCEIANSRLPELNNELFVTHSLHAGLYNRNLPYWITENMIYQPTEAAAVNWWLNSPIHRKAIESDHPYSCGACTGNACIQLFTTFSPK